MKSFADNLSDAAAQTDADMFPSCGPDCEARFEVKLRDFRARIERELNDQMQVAMRKLEDRVCTTVSCHTRYFSPILFHVGESPESLGEINFQFFVAMCLPFLL